MEGNKEVIGSARLTKVTNKPIATIESCTIRNNTIEAHYEIVQ